MIVGLSLDGHGIVKAGAPPSVGYANVALAAGWNRIEKPD
jgi:hypothetical protein